MNNAIKANIKSQDQTTFTRSVWQYDYGQILQITGAELPPAVEVQFSLHEKSGETITRVATTTDGVTEVQIPNELLKRDGCKGDYFIYAYIFVSDEKSGNTKYKIAIAVRKRPKPEEPTDEPEQEENLFHATVVTVNASAERAEKAVSDAENIRDNLNLDLSEKITRPQAAEVGQVLAVKEIDESGKPTVFEAEDVKVPTKTSELENDSGFLTEHQDISGKLDKEKLPEAIDDALAQAKESGEFDGKPGPKGDPGETTYIENPYDDTKLKTEVDKKLTTPTGNAKVGQILRVQSVNEDGSVVLETVEMPSESVGDVQINGTSIVKDGIAEIPMMGSEKSGLIQFRNGYGLQLIGNYLLVKGATETQIANRTGSRAPILANSDLDYAVKSAMCDGKGAAWTAEEQVAARERMGALGTQDMIDITEITMDAETLKYVFPSFADYRILEISFSKTKKELTGLTGNIWLKLDNVGWVVTSIFGDAYNMFILDASGKSCAGKNMHTNNTQIAINMQGLIVDKKYWDTEFRGAPYILLPNIEWAQYFAECNTAIKVRGIKR